MVTRSRIKAALNGISRLSELSLYKQHLNQVPSGAVAIRVCRNRFAKRPGSVAKVAFRTKNVSELAIPGSSTRKVVDPFLNDDHRSIEGMIFQGRTYLNRF